MRRLSALVLLALVVASFAVWTGSAASTPSQSAKAAAVEKTWRSHLRAGARSYPTEHFHNLSRATFARRLRAAARHYHFTVVRLRVLHPLQAAPLVVVRARKEQALSAATPAILRLIDPKARTNSDRTGWAYEGFMFEARNSQGAPFLATFNWWRGALGQVGGGQWATSQSLYPFPHG
jgi:hypothetical protein